MHRRAPSGPDDVSSALAELRARSVDRRLKAVARLGELLEGHHAPSQLLDALRSPSALVRVESAEALERIGDPRALRALWPGLQDRVPLVRSYVAAVIGMLAGRKELPRLKAAFSTERNSMARIGYHTAFWSLSEPRAPFDIAEMLQDRNYRVRCSAANTLPKMATPGNRRALASALVAAIKNEDTRAAREAMGTSLSQIRKASPRQRVR
jgi:HEAT repeat protein